MLPWGDDSAREGYAGAKERRRLLKEPVNQWMLRQLSKASISRDFRLTTGVLRICWRAIGGFAPPLPQSNLPESGTRALVMAGAGVIYRSVGCRAFLESFIVGAGKFFTGATSLH